jgi:N-hydroxyarylamine O-acetyltransferase
MLQSYLRRIGLDGAVRPDMTTLHAVHRAQARHVPYEAIDVFAGQPVSLDLSSIHEKIVGRRRGGWCYEQNGLLVWALGEIGFNVRRAVAGAWHQTRRAGIMGNHVVGLVELDGRTWLCDLGLGDALRAPVPLEAGTHNDGPLSFRLEYLPDGTWRFWNHPAGDPSNFDLDPGPADETLLRQKHEDLLADPNSSFRLNFQAMRMNDRGATVIYGRVLRRVSVDGTEKTLIEGPDQMSRLLADEFGLEGIDTSPLWPRILARHAQVFGSPDASP